MHSLWTIRGARSGRRRARQPRRPRLCLEHLETRIVPSDNRIFGPIADAIQGLDVFHANIVAGAANGTPADSPSQRVDANTTSSPYAGVGSVQVNTRRGVYIGTGTPIDATHILTAGHVVDVNNDGKANSKDGIKNLYFNLNFGGNLTHQIAVTSVTINPNYTGFNRPSINDDLAILTLASPLPAGVPIYNLPTSDLASGTTITLVGYGRSGNGVSGYTVEASFTVKRSGVNNADAFYGQDDSGQPAANEVFRYDFDGPTGSGTFGGPTLGNDKETTIGGGDSGGPSFVGDVIVGVNTFTQGFNAPRFGSLGGGINVFPYVTWINQARQASAPAAAETDAGGNSGNGKGEPQTDATAAAALSEIPREALHRFVGIATTNVNRTAVVTPVVTVQAAPTAPRARLTPASSLTNFSLLRTWGYVTSEEAVENGEATVEAVMPAAHPAANPNREQAPPPAPAPVPPPAPVPMPENTAPTQSSRGVHDPAEALVWEAADSDDDAVCLAVAMSAVPTPTVNAGAMAASLVLFLSGVSASAAAPQEPRRKRARWLA